MGVTLTTSLSVGITLSPTPVTIATTGAINTQAAAAVYSRYGQAALVNEGRVHGADYGVTFLDGGFVRNVGTSSVIYGGSKGVRILTAPGTVFNAGTIDGQYFQGIYLQAGGYVDNIGTASTITALRTPLYPANGVAMFGMGTVLNQGGIHADGVGVVIDGGTFENLGIHSTVFGTDYAVEFSENYTLNAEHTIVITAGAAGGYVLNEGTLESGTPGSAVNLLEDGIVDNSGPAALIEGGVGGAAVNFGYDLNTGLPKPPQSLLNTGTITSVGGDGVQFAIGGTLDNASGNAFILGGGGSGAGVGFDEAGTLINYGTIADIVDPALYVSLFPGHGDGLFFLTDGSVANFGTIFGSGTAGAGILIEGTGLVTDAGTIQGASGVAIEMDGAGSRLILDPGAVLGGSVEFKGGGTLELAAGNLSAGTIAGIGDSFTGVTVLEVDSGASWAFSGRSTMAGSIAVTNDGVITVDGTAGLTIDGPLTGTGVIDVDPSTIVLGGSVSSGQTISLVGTGNLLVLEDPEQFHGTISGFGPGDTIVLDQNLVGYQIPGFFDGTLIADGGPSKQITLSFADPSSLSAGFTLFGDGPTTIVGDFEGPTGTGKTISIAASTVSTLAIGLGTNDVLLNHGTIISGVGASSDGVGVYIENFAGATIAGVGGYRGAPNDGVLLGQFGTIANEGSIFGYYAGVRMYDGGILLNGGTVNSQGEAVDVMGYRSGIGTIINQGTLESHYGYGVLSRAVSIVENIGTAAEVIGGNGIRLLEAGTVFNSGLVEATGTVAFYGTPGAVVLKQGGTVTNFGTILGQASGVVLQGSGLVLNAGTIEGAGGVALAFETGAGTLIVDAGAVFEGTVEAEQGGTLVLASGAELGTLAGFGTEYTGFTALDVNVGAAWEVTGNVGIAVTNSGTIEAGAAGPLSFNGPVSGAGVILLDATTLALNNSIASGQTVSLSGGLDKLDLGDPSQFHGTIAGMVFGDTIDLTGISLSSITREGFADGVLTLGGGFPKGIYLTFANPSTFSYNFSLSADGTGTDITLMSAGLGPTTHTLSTSLSTGITLTGAGDYGSPFTVTPTGVIGSFGGVVSKLTAPVLLNDGSITGDVYFMHDGSVTNGAASSAIYGYFAVEIANTGTVLNYGTIHAHIGVELGGGIIGQLGTGGGYVGNFGTIMADISGRAIDETGIALFGFGTAVNEGGIYADIWGVDLGAGGLVENRGVHASVSAGAYGVILAADPGGALATVVNQGTISGAYYGIYSRGGGDIINSGTAAQISGPSGMKVLESASILNSGLIEGVSTRVTSYNFNSSGQAEGLTGGNGDGILLESGGTLSNSGTILGLGTGTVTEYGGVVVTYGTGGTGVVLDGPGTVLNAGTIYGKSGVAVAFESGASTLIVDPGAVFGGSVEVKDGGGALVLAAGSTTGTLAGFDTSYSGFSTLDVAPAAVWDFAGATSLAASLAVTVDGTIDEGAADRLTVASAIHGTGAIILDATTLALNGSVASGLAVGFVGAGNLLNLNDPSLFEGTLAGFGVGDTIDLAGIALGSITHEELFAGVLELRGPSLALNLTFASPATFADNFSLSAAGTGTDIELNPASPFVSVHTLSTSISTGITLTAADSFASPFTITSTGTIVTTVASAGTIAAPGGVDVYSTLLSPTLTNAGLIKSADVGVSLIGGTVLNDKTGVIDATRFGIQFNSGNGGPDSINDPGTVLNAGLILGDDNAGIQLQSGGGYIDNTGTIGSSAADGVQALYGGSVQNEGVITGQFDGVYGGGFTNAGSASYVFGVNAAVAGAEVFVTNDGTLVSAGIGVDATNRNYDSYIYNVGTGSVIKGAEGIYTADFGNVVNAGTIIGTNAAALVLEGGGTVVNSGTIIGGVEIGGPGQVIIDPGAVFDGGVGIYRQGRIDLASGLFAGTITSLATNFYGIYGVFVDPGAAWDIAGTTSLTASLTNSGTIDEHAADRLTVTSAISGSGAIILDATTLTLEAGVASGQTFIFDGAGNLLDLSKEPALFEGTISGFVAGDTIDLGGLAYAGTASATIGSGGTLLVTEGGKTDVIHFVPSDAGETIDFANDGAGGTKLITTISAGGGSTAPVIVGPGPGAPDVQLGNGSSEILQSGAKIFGTTIASGGALAVLAGGTITAAVLNGGVSDVLGTSYDSKVDTGGYELVGSPGSIGGRSDNTVIEQGGYQYVLDGGTASNTTLAAGGTMLIGVGGQATNDIDFAGSDAVLSVAGTVLPTAVLSGFYQGGAFNDGIILTGFTYAAGQDSATLESHGTLLVDLNGTLEKLHFNAAQSNAGHSFALTTNSLDQVVIIDPATGTSPDLTFLAPATAAGSTQIMSQVLGRSAGLFLDYQENSITSAAFQPALKNFAAITTLDTLSSPAAGASLQSLNLPASVVALINTLTAHG